MKAPAEKSPDNQRQAVTQDASQQQDRSDAEFQFVDNRAETTSLRQLQETADNSPRTQGLSQLKTMMNSSPRSGAMRSLQAMVDNSPRRVSMGFQAGLGDVTAQRVEDEEVLQGEFAVESPAQLAQQSDAKPNNTGLPDNLKAGVESLSGLSLDNVKVHYNSSEPAQLNAHAYAQGTDIHLGPGQEQHLPHEAWHVVQQAQGRVKPTMQMKDGVSVNDEKGLEAEADLMGGEAVAGVVQARQESSGSIESDPIGMQKMKNGATQLAKEKTQVYGITHLVRMVDGSIYSEDFRSNEYCEVSDEDVVEIESDVSVFSRRGPNQEVTKFNKEDSNGPQHYLWYLVKSINDEMVDKENIFIREDTFHKIKVKPTAKTIGQFFNWLHSGKIPDLSALSIDADKLQLNKAAYLLEFRERLKRLNPIIDDRFIDPLFEKLIEVFVRKDEALARSFLALLTSKAGLTPLEQESERLYWSGKESRAKAYEISQDPPGATALEKTQIGQLLDKFPFFESIPWDLSTILWAEVSRCFSVGSRGTMNVYIDGGFAKGNVFWNDELPALRLMQNYGLVDNIVIHIWHTKDKRWVREFDIQSENLNMVFNKAIRISAPTFKNPDNTRSYRYDNPINVSVVRRILMRYLQSLRRGKPLIFHNFRLESGVFADAIRTDYGMEVSFFNYGSEAKKITQIYAQGGDLEKLIKSAEFYLMANCTDYESIPRGLVFSQTKIRSGTKIIANKTDNRWVYN